MAHNSAKCPLNIAIIGPGRIGSIFAYQLGKHGHTITVVGRAGKRFTDLQAAGAVLVSKGKPDRIPVSTALQLDQHISYDLILVTVFAPQVQPLLPVLRASKALQVVFMFNTFEPAKLSSSMGNKLTSFALPLFSVELVDGEKLNRSSINCFVERTAVSNAALGGIFTAAGIPSDVYTDFTCWLQSHAAFAAPVLIMAPLVHRQGGKGLSWGQARQHAQAVSQGFAVVRHHNAAVIPSGVQFLSWLPTSIISMLLWGFSRTAAIRDAGTVVEGEASMLIEQMIRAAEEPSKTTALRAILPKP